MHSETRSAVCMTGVWMATGTPLRGLYPCRCAERGYRDCGKSEPWGCPCYGRADDVVLMPDACCARRFVPLAERRLTY